VSSSNEFLRQSKDFVFEKPKNAKFKMGLVYQEKRYGIWVDENEGYYYVNRKIPKNTNCPIFALTASDNKVNYIAARKAEVALKGFTDLYYLGIVRYETATLKAEFIDILALFGVR
ncbi:MAG: phage DNA encapsidation protein, partial [Exiguobacterium sp.]|nr:phage DNA encapsidation protein [Exiguobacterium sp.]